MGDWRKVLDHFKIDYATSGLFLLLLAVAGNYAAETFSCSVRRLLSDNMWAKQAVILFMIYFTINFTSGNSISPRQQFQTALYVWVFFLMFTKMQLGWTVFAFGLLITIYVLRNQIDYLKQSQQADQAQRLELPLQIAQIAVLITVLCGFGLYYLKQRHDHPDFSYFKFVFGTLVCGTV